MCGLDSGHVLGGRQALCLRADDTVGGIVRHALRAARLRAKLTQAQAAVLVSSSERSWQDWEGGRRRIPMAKYQLFIILADQLPAPVAPLATIIKGV